MIIILNRDIKRHLLYITDDKDEIESFYKVINTLKRNMLVGTESFIRYIIRNIDGFFWSVDAMENDVRLTLRVLLEETSKGPVVKIMGMPDGYNKSPLSLQLINKILEINDIPEDEKLCGIYILGKLVDRLVLQFLTAFDLEPGINVIEMDDIYFEDDNIYFIIGENNGSKSFTN